MTIRSSRPREHAGRDRPFEALAHERRRHVLSVLRDAGDSLTVRELAVEIARLENGAAAGTVDPDRVDSIRLGLYHRHAPKLADVGLVEYDAEERVVAPAGPTLRADDMPDLLQRGPE